MLLSRAVLRDVADNKISHRAAYLRGLLIQGARSALQVALLKKCEQRIRLQQWMADLQARVGSQNALVAVANKHARMI
jgi:hypothetical protein